MGWALGLCVQRVLVFVADLSECVVAAQCGVCAGEALHVLPETGFHPQVSLVRAAVTRTTTQCTYHRPTSFVPH